MRRVLCFAAIVALFAVSSCKKVDPPFIKAEMDKVEIPTAGENVSVSVSSNFEWQVKSDQIWAKVKRNVEKETVDIFVSKNSLTDDRTATVTLYSENADMPVATITVIQRQKNAIAIEDSGTYEINSDEQDIQIHLQANVEYTVEIPSDAASWLSVQPFTKGMQPVVCHISVKGNDSLYERRAEITVKAPECSSILVTVIQLGCPQRLSYTLGKTGQFKAPYLTTDDAEVKITWAGQTKIYYSGMKMDVDSAPADVQIEGHRITVVEFSDIVELESMDFTKLY